MANTATVAQNDCKMKTIPYGHQYIDKEDIESVVKVLRSDWLTQGPMVEKFEKSLCKYTGAKYAVAVSNGTAALHVACLAAGIGKNDEVVTSPLTFLASANCVLYCGGKPIFADISSSTGNILTSEIGKKISNKTKAVIPVHFAGLPCDVKQIKKAISSKKIIIIEDAAHAIGAKCRGEKIGSCKYSNMTIFSFHPVKAITTGEGGAVMTNDKELYKRLLLYRNHGVTKTDLVGERHGDWYYEMQQLGYNYRITDIQSALGITQMKKLPRFINKRRKIAQIYRKAFEGNSYFDIPHDREHFDSAYHLFPIRLKKKYMNKRSDIFSKMRKAGLGVQVHYIPVYLQPYYKGLGYRKGICPTAEDFYDRIISIPIYYGMKKGEIEYVIKTIFKIFKEG